MASRRETLEEPLKQESKRQVTLDHFVMVRIHARQVVQRQEITWLHQKWPEDSKFTLATYFHSRLPLVPRPKAPRVNEI
jgi:hypothetical protein